MIEPRLDDLAEVVHAEIASLPEGVAPPSCFATSRALPRGRPRGGWAGRSERSAASLVGEDSDCADG